MTRWFTFAFIASLAACGAPDGSEGVPDVKRVPEPTSTEQTASARIPCTEGACKWDGACIPNTTCGSLHTETCGTGDDACKAEGFCAFDGRCRFFCNFDGHTLNENLRQLCFSFGGSCNEFDQVCKPPRHGSPITVQTN